jgi:uncharacterized protein YndB with AHSA1/START domain
MPEPDELQPDDLTIERTTELDLDIDELWTLISTPQGWSSWLVDETDLAVRPGSEGMAMQDGAERAVHIETVDEGRGVAFSWWDRDDPSSASFVRLDIVELPSGGSQLHISERFLGATASATASSSNANEDLAWQVRFVSLWLLALHSTVLA